METAKALYERLKGKRDIYIKRAEDCALMTIPSLFPREVHNEATSYQTPNQSIGARGVNNMSSKLLLALLPPNSTFFRLTPTEAVTAEIEQSGDTDALDEIEKELEKLERKIMLYIETQQIRTTIKEALNQLLVAGNCLLFLPPAEGGAKLYRLNNYVLQRDALGNVIQAVTLDVLSYATLPEDLKAYIDSDGQKHELSDDVEIYTHIYLKGNYFYTYQEINDVKIKDSEQQYPITKTPYIPLRLIKVDGEDYGRSYIEEYLGDLINLDAHCEALRNLASITADIKFLVNPQGRTSVRRLQRAKAGDYVAGRIEDINALQTNKTSDLQVSMQYVQNLERQLGYVFMLPSAVQRNAERVTAEEIRQVAGELEDTLGSTYSILSQELQLPLVRRLITQLEQRGELPPLPEGLVEPTITTGLEALGRGNDLNKLMTFNQIIASNPMFASYLKANGFISRIATSLSIDTAGLIKTDEEIAQEQRQQMMQQMALQATPQLAQGMMQQEGMTE